MVRLQRYITQLMFIHAHIVDILKRAMMTLKRMNTLFHHKEQRNRTFVTVPFLLLICLQVNVFTSKLFYAREGMIYAEGGSTRWL